MNEETLIRTPSDYAREARAIYERGNLPELKIVFLSSYTSEILKSYMTVELAKRGYLCIQYFAPFNQFEQEIYNLDSGTNQFNPDFIVIHMRIDDIQRDLIHRCARYSEDELTKIREDILLRYKSILEGIRSRGNAKILVFNFADDRMKSEYFTSSPVIKIFQDFLQKLNNELYEICDKIASCYFIDYQQIILNTGLSNWEDLKLYYMARIPFNSNAQIRIARTLSRTIAAIDTPPIKCIVLDLDNTLWGGVVGEDGISGIQLGNDYPGNTFKEFQYALLGLRDQGVLLAIASKNNMIDVVEVFEKHTDCPLNIDDFSAVQVHWEDKATSINKIVKELNIGLDSIVFFDDNPVERDWVKSQLPDVKVIDAPKNPMGYINSLLDSSYFDRFSLTREDKERSDQYKRQEQRKKLYNSSNTVDDFLKDLKMKVTIGYVDDLTIGRVEQLVNKTNQFNLTTKRYTRADIDKFVDNQGIVLWLRVEDRYGDNGIVGVAIIENILADEWIINTFLLSCRVIGRKIETVFISEIVAMAKNNNAKVISGQYIPTKKNNLVSTYYEQHGFALVDRKKGIWKFNLDSNIKAPEYIEVVIT